MSKLSAWAFRNLAMLKVEIFTTNSVTAILISSAIWLRSLSA